MNDKAPSLTDCLKSIGEEKVDICIDSESMQVTKTEALARKMYVMAMGGIEEVKGENDEVLTVVHRPDYRVAKMIREFTEGKAPVGEKNDNKQKRPVAGKFSSAIGRRLNSQLDKKGDNDDEN